jgi:hypothetical protein
MREGNNKYFLYPLLIVIQLQLLVVLVTLLLENNGYTFISKKLSLICGHENRNGADS